jgi:hypothetical protein
MQLSNFKLLSDLHENFQTLSIGGQSKSLHFYYQLIVYFQSNKFDVRIFEEVEN